MKPVTRHVLSTTAALVAAAAAGLAVYIASGAYNIAADDPHTAPVRYLLQTLRERSMETRAAGLQIPDLGEQRRIVEGAGNYQAMCAGCHLAPSMEATELSRGLYPSPPNLSREAVEPRHAFWAIKHGIKASAMPAWGRSMNDETAWNLTAFLVKLPQMNAQQYEQTVASSGGHAHGGAEAGEAHHQHHGKGDQDEPAETIQAADPGHSGQPGAEVGQGKSAEPAPAIHVHGDGHKHRHTAGPR